MSEHDESSNDTIAAPELTLMAARKAKADRVRERGEDPFTNDIDPASISDLGSIRAHYGSARKDDDAYDADQVAALHPSSPWSRWRPPCRRG